MAGKFSRSWEIFKASAAVLRDDKKLVIFPLVSTVAAMGLVAAFGLVYWWWGSVEYAARGELTSYTPYALGFVFCFAAYLVIVFFNTALVAVATADMDGREPTITDGLRFAWSKIGTIIGYVSIAATVGVLLNFLEERLGAVGALIMGLADVAWTVATFLVVPVLVNRNIGPLDAVRESARLLKETWGENIIANGGMGLVFSILYIPLGFLTVLITIFTLLGYGSLEAGERAVATVTVVSVWLPLVMLFAVHGTLQGIYSAALYRFATYASDETAGAPISGVLLESAFKQKGRKSRRWRR